MSYHPYRPRRATRRPPSLSVDPLEPRALLATLVVTSPADAGPGIVLDTLGGDVIRGNYLGTDATGKAALGNGIGVLVNGVPGNRIGGTSVGDGNLISGNALTGVQIQGEQATGNLVLGNDIGT